MLAAVLAAGAVATGPASGSDASPRAVAAAKTCAKGKVAVRRPGRGTVCARRCPSGRRHRVSSRGRVSCVRRRTTAPPAPPPGGAPTAPPGADAPAPPPADSGGPAAGGYSGTTEQNRPVTFSVANGEVTSFEAGVNTWCSTQGNQRIVFDAIANVPPMAIGPDGTFSYSGPPDTGNMQISGRVVGNTATGTVGMNRGDTNYDAFERRTYFGSCSASDVKWSAALS